MSLERLTERAQEALKLMQQKAAESRKKLGKDAIESIKASEIYEVLKSSNGVAFKVLGNVPDVELPKNKLVELDRLIKEAFFQALKFQHTYVGTEHILLALLKITGSRDSERVRDEIIALNLFPTGFKNAEQDSKTPLLSLYGDNATYQSYLSTEEFIYREELNGIISILLQKQNPNPLIVGETGVGKESLIGLLIRRINSLDVPPKLLGFHVIDFDLVQFIASAFNKGINLEQSINMLLEEVRSVGRVILHIKNFQNIFIPTNSGVAVPLIYSLFKSGLSSMGIKVIATMDSTIYDKLNTENASLISNFTMLELGEPNEKQTLRVMQSRARHLEDYHKIKIPAPVINYAYKKAKALESDLRFPQKGIDLLDRACAKLILKESKVPQRYKSLIDETILLAGKIDESIETGDYKTALKHRSNLQKVETKLSSDEKSMFLTQKLTLTTEIIDIAVEEEEMSKSAPLPVEDLKSLKDRVRKRIIGQDSAIDVVVKSLIRSKLGLNSKKRPVGNFLFLGPTGVGKTELAKVLADEAFGSGSLIRLDMSDFSEKHTVARLVGAPPGYVGFGEGGELTKKIELKPQSVVLFDEIEKAHPDILNILLQIMEEGQLVDAVGTAFNFNEAIVILTSNLGTEILHRKDIGFDNELKSEDNVESRLTSNLKRFIKPELINRFDEVIVFRRLSKQSQSKILEILLTEFKASLKYKKITLVVEKEVKAFLLEKGYSQEFGARSMRRLIEKELIDRVAAFILDSNIKDASQIRLYARLSNSKIVISSR